MRIFVLVSMLSAGFMLLLAPESAVGAKAALAAYVVLCAAAGLYLQEAE